MKVSSARPAAVIPVRRIGLIQHGSVNEEVSFKSSTAGKQGTGQSSTVVKVAQTSPQKSLTS